MASHTKKRRKGLIVVLSAVLMIVMFAIVAFAVDVGYIVNARTELQRTVDACAMAAAMRLPDTTEALNVATRVAQENLGMVGPDLDPADVEFGVWDRNSAKFISPPPPYWEPTAAKVSLFRVEERGNPLTLFIAYMINNDTADASATSIAMVDRDLCGPFIGIDWLSVPGNPKTDSYNSWEGPYSPGIARDRGSLCSDGPINIDGNPYVRGHARAGKDHQVTITGSPIVTGSIGSRLKPLNLPPVDASEAEFNNDNDSLPLMPEGNGWKSPVDENGNFLLDGNREYDLPGGTYYFNDFELAGEAILNVTGPVNIFVTGDFRRAGGVTVNFNTQKASNFQVYSTGGAIDITSNNDFYGVVYAPHSNVVLDGSSDLFGAIVGKTLTLTGSGWAHYDEALELDHVTVPVRSALVR